MPHSPFEGVAAHLTALARADAQTNAVAFFEDERALADARDLDRAYARDGIAGPLARRVEDLERVLPIICGPDWRDAGVAPVPLPPASQPGLRQARFAVVTSEETWVPAAELTAATERAAAGPGHHPAVLGSLTSVGTNMYE